MENLVGKVNPMQFGTIQIGMSGLLDLMAGLELKHVSHKVWVKKRAHIQKLAIIEKSTISVLFS